MNDATEAVLEEMSAEIAELVEEYNDRGMPLTVIESECANVIRRFDNDR